MKPNAMKSAMIRTAVMKGIRDMKENPKRGIRNLVELGEMFAGGRSQKDFFEGLLAQLRDENSAYYQIVARIVRQADAAALANFGINLGYNALSHGASIIRRVEETEGFNVPWCLTIDCGRERLLLPFDLEAVMEEGMELGIYCYLIQVDAAYPGLDEMMQMLGERKECAILLFCGPETIDDAFCKALAGARHIAAFMNMDGDAAGQDAAAARLLATGNVCGGFSRAPGLRAEDVSAALLERPERLGLPVMAFAREREPHPPKGDEVGRGFTRLRAHLEVPVLPVDLYGDLVHADRAISDEACLVDILGDGRLVLLDAEQNRKVTGLNIHERSLREALRAAAPKNGAPKAAGE